jgi:hypothetical protein
MLLMKGHCILKEHKEWKCLFFRLLEFEERKKGRMKKKEKMCAQVKFLQMLRKKNENIFLFV